MYNIQIFRISIKNFQFISSVNMISFFADILQEEETWVLIEWLRLQKFSLFLCLDYYYIEQHVGTHPQIRYVTNQITNVM